MHIIIFNILCKPSSLPPEVILEVTECVRASRSCVHVSVLSVLTPLLSLGMLAVCPGLLHQIH